MSSFSRWFPRGIVAVTFAVVVAASNLLQAAPQLLPGVYGYGADRAINPAGFGSSSTIIEVTNLNDSGTGSLRAAVEATGSRVVVFRTSGIIDLESTLLIAPGKGNITIAGQTALSPGISIHNGAIHVQANNVLVQHLRFRPGDRWTSIKTSNRDAVIVSHSSNVLSNVVFDHCTFSWSLDEVASPYNSWDNITFNKCMFVEPLHVSNHIDEGTLTDNVPKQAETLSNTKSGFSSTSNTSSSLAVGGTYQTVSTNSVGDYIEYTLPIISSGSARGSRHLNITGIKGSNRAQFRAEIRDPGNNIILNSGEIVDQYASSASQHTWVSQQNMTQSFTIPANVSSLKVRLIVTGKNGSSSSYTLGIDQIAISDGHGLGPLTSSGVSGAGKLSMTGCIFAHFASRGPWANAKQFYFANNVIYNRFWSFTQLGHNPWNDPIHVAMLGNTYIEGRDMSPSGSILSPIENMNVRANSEIYVGSASDNTYDYGDRSSPPPMVDDDLDDFLVGSDPTAKTAGLSGVTPLTPANAFAAALLGAGARPADRDAHELRIIDEIADAGAITALASRPGSIKHTVEAAGGWPTYAVNAVTHTYPSNPNSDDDSDGYTNIEEWLHQKAAAVEGSEAIMVGHWPLNEGSGTTTADASGNNNNGTLSPAPAWTTGILDDGLNFDGVDDAVGIGSPAVLDNLPGLSVAAWISADTMGEGGKGRIVAKTSGTSPVNGWHLHANGTNALTFGVDYDGTTNLIVTSADNAFTTGNWHHVAATWDGSPNAAGVRLYVDGVEVGSYATTQSGAGSRVDDASSSLYLGNESTGARTFDGVLDDVRVYQGVLSQTDIAALADPGSQSPPAAIFDTFEDGNADGWTPDGGTWSVVTNGTQVYRQSNNGSGPVFSVLDATSGWTDQVVEADVRLVSVSGTNRFFGLLARYNDSANHYYFILRTNNTIELKKLVGGSATTLDSDAFTVTTGTSYALKLEVIGTTLKAYINGQLKLQATDSQFASGSAGVRTYYTSVDFDDVYVDPVPNSPVLVADDFQDGDANGWTPSANSSWSVVTDGTLAYRQTDETATGSTMSVTGDAAWTAQIIEVDAKLIAVSGTNRWFGLLARYTDENNHYYVTFRTSNVIELKKMVGGTYTTLDSASLTLTTGTWYVLKLKAIGDSLKVYVDGELKLQATDSSLAAGKVGLAMYKGDAVYDDVIVTKP